jgi:hypothetical protein
MWTFRAMAYSKAINTVRIVSRTRQAFYEARANRINRSHELDWQIAGPR